MKKSLILILIIIVVSLFAAQWMQIAGVETQSATAFNDKANLALRQTGHQLLLLNGDSTSTVPPIEELDASSFQLELNACINYDTLSFLLTNAFNQFGIKSHFNTMVLDCDSEQIMLGFNDLAVIEGVVACAGREQDADCNIIKVVFEDIENSQISTFYAQLGLGLLLALLLARLFFFPAREKELDTLSSLSNNTESNIENDDVFNIGNSTIDIKNQIYKFDSKAKDLTFREAKLLGYFAQNSNQILGREQLLDEVWGDEGVIVGRSLDVFVSRLRKIITDDHSINIKTVHGVGYKFEIEQT